MAGDRARRVEPELDAGASRVEAPAEVSASAILERSSASQRTGGTCQPSKSVSAVAKEVPQGCAVEHAAWRRICWAGSVCKHLRTLSSPACPILVTALLTRRRGNAAGGPFSSSGAAAECPPCWMAGSAGAPRPELRVRQFGPPPRAAPSTAGYPPTARQTAAGFPPRQSLYTRPHALEAEVRWFTTRRCTVCARVMSTVGSLRRQKCAQLPLEQTAGHIRVCIDLARSRKAENTTQGGAMERNSY